MRHRLDRILEMHPPTELRAPRRGVAGLSAQRLVEIARQYVGVPFRHQGRTRFGVDCIGLVVLARNELEPWPLGMLSPVNYRRNPERRLLAGLEANCDQIYVPETGCVALIAWPRQAFPSHVALLTPENMIHAYAGAGKVVETGYRAHWLRWTHSLWRLPGVEA